MKQTFPTQFQTTQEQLAICTEVLEKCRQSNEPLADMIAALAAIITTNLKDQSEGWL